MNVFELLFFVAMIALGIGAATFVYPIGGWWLAIPGFVFAFLFLPGILFVEDRYRKRVYQGKWMPDCLCGGVEFGYEDVGEEVHLLCRQCKTRYEKLRNQTWIYEGNEKRFHKRFVKRKGWI